MVGMATFAGLSVWSPVRGDVAADRFRTQLAVRDEVLAFADSKGVTWLSSAPMPEVCSAVGAASNLTFGISVRIGGSACGSPPPAGATTAALSFVLGSRWVTLAGWSSAGV